MTAYAGQIANPTDYNTDIQKLVARARRETDSTAGTTEAGVLRIDGFAAKSGHHYRISTSPLQINSTVLNDVVTARIRIATDGTTATTSSTQLGQMTADHNISAGKGWSMITEHTPGADQTCSILLTVARTSGTGNVKIEGNAVYPICIWVDDMGPDTGDVGIEL